MLVWRSPLGGFQLLRLWCSQGDAAKIKLMGMDLGSELFGSVLCITSNQHPFSPQLIHMIGVQDRKVTHSEQFQLIIRDGQSRSTSL